MTALGARTRPAGCASDLALEELVAGEARAPDEDDGDRLREHVAGCARCRERMDALAAEPILAPPLSARAEVDALDRDRRARRRRLGAAGGLTAVAAAMVLLIAVRGGHRPRVGGDVDVGDRVGDDDSTRVKGALALTVHIKRRDGTVAAANGDGSLRPGEEMRFSLALASPGYAVVLGLDATPSVTVYVPAAASAPAGPVRVEPPGPIVLPGSIVADGAAGVERVFAVVCPRETPPATLRRRAEAALAAAGRPDAVTSLGTGCLEASVLLHKDAAGR